jgi:DNA-binding response OmpR family regulator
LDVTKESLKRGPERPLVIAIDDDPAILELLRATIEPLGRSFLGASSLAQGHELVRSNQAELLVIDGMLPDGSGLDFVTQVLSAQGEATLPVVFLSAFFKDMGSYERLRQAGARKILHKPITPESLRAELGELLIVANGSTDAVAASNNGVEPELQEELERLVVSYRAGLPDLADQLEHWHGQLEQESKGAASQLVALLHRVAGSAGTHRLHSISLLAGDLEKRIERRESATGWSSQWQELIGNMRQAAVAAQPRVPRRDSPCQGAVDVLLVDDDPEIGRALAPVMRRRCMELRQVHSYDEAERALAAGAPNLMVLDYHLGPGQTGPEIAPALAQYLPASCPTVFLSTHDDIDKRALAAESGGALYLSKSMGVEAIVESISTLLVRGLASAAVALASNDTEVARVVSEGLQGSIASLDTTGDPMALWHLLEKQRYDLLLIDGQLPGYGGPEMCRILKSDVRYQELPVVLLTAANDPAAVQSAMAAAADGWLDRRVDRDQLLRVLTSLLQRRASSRAAEDQAATSAADRSRPAALPRATSFQGLVGNSPPMQEVFRRLQLAARSDTTVVVTGPSGGPAKSWQRMRCTT